MAGGVSAALGAASSCTGPSQISTLVRLHVSVRRSSQNIAKARHAKRAGLHNAPADMAAFATRPPVNPSSRIVRMKG